MSQYTFPFSTYFSNGLSLTLLNTTISSSFPSFTNTSISNGQITFTFTTSITESLLIPLLQNHIPNQLPFYLCYQNTGSWTASNLLLYLSPYNVTSLNLDSYAILYFSVIPTVATINLAISQYIEPPAITSVQVQLVANQNILTTTVGDKLFSVNPQQIIVSQTGRGQFTTISAAINSITSGSVVIIQVYPGTFIETNPIILPTGCSIKAEGSAINTIVVATNSSVPVFETSNGNFIDSLTIVGGSYGVSHNGSNIASFSIVQNCIFSNSTILITGGYGSLVLSRINFAYSDTDNSSFTAITITGGSLVANDIEIITSNSSFAGNGLIATNASLATIDVFSVYYCTNAISINNNSTIKSTLVNIEDCTNACVILPNDTAYTNLISRYCFGTLNIENSTTYDLYIQASASLQFLAAQFDDGKIYNPYNVVINSNIQHYRNAINYQIISGNILIGTESISSTTYIGTNINTNHMLCYLYDGTTYTDESANFRTPIDPPVTLTNQSLYICHQTAITTGFDIYTSLSTNPTISYWNGTTWTSLNYSIYDITNNTFVAQMPSSGTASIYFDNTYAPQQVAINSVTAYWIHVTLANCTITTTTLHSNAVGFNTIGKTRKYGQTRTHKQVYLPVTILSNNLYFLPTQDFDYSSPYTITVHALVTGITLNGQVFATNSASVTAYATGNSLQSITLIAVNVQCIQLSYLSIS